MRMITGSMLMRRMTMLPRNLNPVAALAGRKIEELFVFWSLVAA